MNLRHTLERVGTRVAVEHDRMLEGTPLQESDEILAGVRRRGRAQRRHRMIGGAMSACLLVLTFFVALRGGGSRARDHQAELRRAPATGEPKPGVVHAETTNVPLRFEDGTTVIVEPGATADLREVREHGATLALESGRLSIDVIHVPTSRWNVVAGDFEILVTGTRFEATFDARTKALTVAMTEGTVEVSAPCGKEALSAPHTKTFRCEAAAAAPRVGEPVLTMPVGEPATPRQASPNAAPAAQSSSLRSASQPIPNEKVATKLAPSAASMIAEADAARLAGDGARARALYIKTRERFPRTDGAAKAAFLLGRMADASGSADEAQRWYETATSESPSGAFAQDALGRRIELEQRRGNVERARALAKDYLRKFPDGPYKAYAVSVVDSGR